jgi:hypothetical protein
MAVISEDVIVALDQAVMERGGRREAGEVRFVCPVHDDHHPSARWNRGKAVWCCDVCKAGGGARDLALRLGIELATFGVKEVDTVYSIRDRSGQVVAEHLRTDKATGEKSFFWRRNGQNGLGGLRAADLPLYGSEQVAEFNLRRPVFLVEGEKSADHLLAVGVQALATVTGASGAPGPESLRVLRDRHVVLWPDADEVGIRHMERIATALVGIAAILRMYTPPGLPEGGDAVEWINQRVSDCKHSDLIVGELERIAGDLPLCEAASEQASPPVGGAEAAMKAPAPDAVGVALSALSSATDAQAAEGPLRQLRLALRGADALTEVTVREQAVAALEGTVSAPAKVVDAALRSERPAPAGQGRKLEFEEPEPWPVPVDGAELLRDLASTFQRFVALPPFAADTIALFVLHAHALDTADISPILTLASPTKRCGKTRTLTVLRGVVPRPALTSNITAACVFRSIEAFSPTLLVDEGDSFISLSEELRGILNGGHTRDTAYVMRTVGDEHEPRLFSTWCPKAIALIGHLPDTLADRSIVVPMKRRAPNEHVERLLHRPGQFGALRRQAARWAANHRSDLEGADPLVPDRLDDRAADNWRPLLAIADLAGGEWPERARRASLALSGGDEAQDGAREQLLGDLQVIFLEREVERIFTEDILADLSKREDRPWREWRAGKQLTAVQLARLLRPFGVKPGTQRIGNETKKGYAKEDFAESFGRYLPPEPSQPSHPNIYIGLDHLAGRHTSMPVTGAGSSLSSFPSRVVTDVTDQEDNAGWKDVG